MAVFKFLGGLKESVPNGQVALDGEYTVAGALSAISNQYAALRQALYVDGSKQLHDYNRILVNGEMIGLLPDAMDTGLNPEDIVVVLPPTSGG